MRVEPSTGKSSNSSSSSSGATDSLGFSVSASLGGMVLFLVVDMVGLGSVRACAMCGYSEKTIRGWDWVLS